MCLSSWAFYEDSGKVLHRFWKDAVNASERILKKNIGIIKTINKKERIGRNPKTKEEAVIDARRVISFRASKELKRRVNN